MMLILLNITRANCSFILTWKNLSLYGVGADCPPAQESEDYDYTGALLFVFGLLLVYMVAILTLIISMITKSRSEEEIADYLRDLEDMRSAQRKRMSGRGSSAFSSFISRIGPDWKRFSGRDHSDTISLPATTASYDQSDPVHSKERGILKKNSSIFRNISRESSNEQDDEEDSESEDYENKVDYSYSTHTSQSKHGSISPILEEAKFSIPPARRSSQDRRLSFASYAWSSYGSDVSESSELSFPPPITPILHPRVAAISGRARSMSLDAGSPGYGHKEFFLMPSLEENVQDVLL